MFPPKSIPIPRRRFLSGSACGAALMAVSPRRVWGDEIDEREVWHGDTWNGWMTVEGQPVPEGWERSQGVIHLRIMPERTGHIVTRREYGDFVLRFEWKIAPGGNSGIKYLVRSYGDRMLGCEYQIYDARNREVDPKNRTGSIYDLYETTDDSLGRPAGEWNQAMIKVQERRIEHWLNGTQLVAATIGDAEWERRIAESKFNEVENFGKNPLGRIMLTDHGSEVWFRKLEFQAVG